MLAHCMMNQRTTSIIPYLFFKSLISWIKLGRDRCSCSSSSIDLRVGAKHLSEPDYILCHVWSCMGPLVSGWTIYKQILSTINTRIQFLTMALKISELEVHKYMLMSRFSPLYGLHLEYCAYNVFTDPVINSTACMYVTKFKSIAFGLLFQLDLLKN